MSNNVNKKKDYTDAGLKMLKSRYFYKDEQSYSDLIERCLSIIPDNQSHRKEILRNRLNKFYAVFATPILTNAGTGNKEAGEKPRGLPISCFITEFDDKMPHIIQTLAHNSYLSSLGGGVGTGISNVREIGAKISNKGETGGIFPFLAIQNSNSMGISQGSIRGGATVINIDIDHPEIEEFINFRLVEQGSDRTRKFPRLNHTVNIPDEFMEAVINQEPYNLTSRVDGSVVKTIDAFDLFCNLLEIRYNRGEPNIVFTGNVWKNRSVVYEENDIKAKQSNLCLEILLDTKPDMTAVCCLASLNLEFYDEWKEDYELIDAMMYYLDRVLSLTVELINESDDPEMKLNLQRVVKFILNDRSIGLGVMGMHTYLQQKNIPFESALAISRMHEIFGNIRNMVEEADVKLGLELGPCPNAAKKGLLNRFSNTMAIAPTASISYIANSVSPGIDPILTNYSVVSNTDGMTTWKNPYLHRVIKKYAKENDLPRSWVDEQWDDILLHEGSVQHLQWMDDWTKDVYKTAYELDQNWVIELAAARQQYIDQSQSTNLFFPDETNIQYLFNVHIKAWKQGVKTLYYNRSQAAERAKDSANGAKVEKYKIEQNLDYNECLACQ